VARTLGFARSGLRRCGGRVGGTRRPLECALREVFRALDAEPAPEKVSHAVQCSAQGRDLV
jgi:hypothetical protein